MSLDLVVRKLHLIQLEQLRMALDLTKLNAALAAVKSELALLRSRVASDPNDQASVDGIAAQLQQEAAGPTEATATSS